MRPTMKRELFNRGVLASGFGVRARVVLVAVLLVSGFGGMASRCRAQTFTESDWQVAFNAAVARGEVEVHAAVGRIDIVTATHAIEVDRAAKFREGIKQALQAAAALQKRPGLALYIDGGLDTLEAVNYAVRLCREAGVDFWLINEYVTIEDLVRRKGLVMPGAEAAAADPAPGGGAEAEVRADPKTHWLNTDTGTRHNRSCRWFSTTRNGRFCEPDEGTACTSCGG
jgi:hypothetical protein